MGSIEARKFGSTQGYVNRGQIKSQSTQGWDQQRSNEANLVEIGIHARPQNDLEIHVHIDLDQPRAQV